MDRFFVQTSAYGVTHTVIDGAESNRLAPMEFSDLHSAERQANMLNNHPNYSRTAWERLWDRAHRVDHALDSIGFNLFWCCGMSDEFMIVDRRGFEHFTLDLHHDRDLSGITGDETLDDALSNIPESLPDPIRS